MADFKGGYFISTFCTKSRVLITPLYADIITNHLTAWKHQTKDACLWDEILDRENYFTLEEAKILIVLQREEYNHIRPHDVLGYRPPAPQARLLAQPPIISPGLT